MSSLTAAFFISFNFWHSRVSPCSDSSEGQTIKAYSRQGYNKRETKTPLWLAALDSGWKDRCSTGTQHFAAMDCYMKKPPGNLYQEAFFYARLYRFIFI